MWHIQPAERETKVHALELGTIAAVMRCKRPPHVLACNPRHVFIARRASPAHLVARLPGVARVAILPGYEHKAALGNHYGGATNVIIGRIPAPVAEAGINTLARPQFGMAGPSLAECHQEQDIDGRDAEQQRCAQPPQRPP